MAKRRRLSLGETEPHLETKSLIGAPLGVAPVRTRPPIADVAGSAAAAAALTDVTRAFTEARDEGRMVFKLPLEVVEEGHLIRDRVTLDPGEMETLKASLKARGQQTPIEVVALGTRAQEPRYGLISGWRRLAALREIAQEEGRVTEVQVLAFVRTPDSAADAYTAMVEENEIRVGLSYFERAHIVARSVFEGIFPTEQEALIQLFASASRAKRSKIKSFLPLVAELGAHLKFPNAVGERQGLALAQRLADGDFARRLKDRLRKANIETDTAEQALLGKALTDKETAPRPTAPDDGIQIKRGRGHVTISGAGLTEARLKELEALIASWS